MSNRNTPKYMQPCGATGCPNLIGPKGGKGYCPRHYRRFKKYGDAMIILASDYHSTWSKCTVKGCMEPVRSRFSELCMKHYHRSYRHGDVKANFHNISVRGPGKYRSVYSPRHPLAGASGKVYEHRVILYDAIGGGAHLCYWCDDEVHWDVRSTDPGGLTVDHLNGAKDDNRIENLVPSCMRCNGGRASSLRHRKLKKKYGAWAVNDTIAQLKNGRRSSVNFEEVGG